MFIEMTAVMAAWLHWVLCLPLPLSLLRGLTDSSLSQYHFDLSPVSPSLEKQWNFRFNNINMSSEVSPITFFHFLQEGI